MLLSYLTSFHKQNQSTLTTIKLLNIFFLQIKNKSDFDFHFDLNLRF